LSSTCACALYALAGLSIYASGRDDPSPEHRQLNNGELHLGGGGIYALARLRIDISGGGCQPPERCQLNPANYQLCGGGIYALARLRIANSGGDGSSPEHRQLNLANYISVEAAPCRYSFKRPAGASLRSNEYVQSAIHLLPTSTSFPIAHCPIRPGCSPLGTTLTKRNCPRQKALHRVEQTPRRARSDPATH
jgi:hypothetical protein